MQNLTRFLIAAVLTGCATLAMAGDPVAGKAKGRTCGGLH